MSIADEPRIHTKHIFRDMGVTTKRRNGASEKREVKQSNDTFQFSSSILFNFLNTFIDYLHLKKCF